MNDEGMQLVLKEKSFRGQDGKKYHINNKENSEGKSI